MARFADPYSCPSCGRRLPIDVVRCVGCRVDLRSPVATELLQTLRHADDLLAQLRTEAAETTAPATAERTPYPAPTPPAARRHRPGLSGASVPRILLSLGALCLLVAAVIFLAVAWSWLGVGGRTAVLVALTAITGAGGVLLRRRGLRWAAEALIAVSLGLLTLDVVGAESAGWLGALSVAQLVCLTSAVVGVVAAVLTTTTRLVAPQLVLALTVTSGGLGAIVWSDRGQVVAVLVVLGYLALADARLGELLALRIVAGGGAGWWWLGLLLFSWDTAAADPSVHALWADRQGWGLLASGLLPVVAITVPTVRTIPRAPVILTAGAAALLTATAALPAYDEGATVVAVTAIVVLLVWTAVDTAVPGPWALVSRTPMAVAAVVVAGISVGLAGAALANTVGQADPFTAPVTVRLPEPDVFAAPVLLIVGVTALGVGVLAVLPRLRTAGGLGVAGTAVVAAAIGTLALQPVPLWCVVVALALLAAALVGDGVRRPAAFGVAESGLGGVALLLAVLVALPSAVLTSAIATLAVLATAAARWRSPEEAVRLGGGLLLGPALAGLGWSVLEVAGVDEQWRGLAALVVVGLLAIAWPAVEVEIGALVGGFAAGVSAIALADDLATSLAIHLTVAGALLCASALVHPTRRALGWPGALLLAAATWVRLADLGVEAPEAYTLPSATTLLVLGLVRLRRDPAAATRRALGPGLGLATVPSLLWVLDDPVSVRAAVLGLGCLALVVGGAVLRWSAPLLAGAVVGVVLVVRELTPYAAVVPQWLLIGVAGTLLLVVGITWESRIRDVRRAGAYVARLR